jgi:mono/diheme cytochrome c family protein
LVPLRKIKFSVKVFDMQRALLEDKCAMSRFSKPFFCTSMIATSLMVATTTSAETGNVQRGRQFARANCERCHSIDKVTPSSLTIAPPFRNLGQRYPVETLREALAEGIVTAHQNMPQFRLAPDQVNDFLAFLNSIQTGR